MPGQAGAQSPTSTVASAPDPVVEALRERVDALAAGAAVTFDDELLRAANSLPQLYQANGYRPLWDGARLQSLLDVLRDVEDDGLRSSDYHEPALRRLLAAADRGPALERAKLDLLATDAYALLVYHLYFGKVDPVAIESTWNFARREIDTLDALTFVLNAIRSNRVRSSLDAVRPANWLYAAGRAALAAHRGIAALGGWPTVPAGPTLRPGDSDPRVPALRARLMVTGELATATAPTFAAASALTAPAAAVAAAATAAESFDPAVEAALRRFQRRHRLGVDGNLGAATLRELNVPVEQRIDQIRLNLERGRWVLHEIKDGDLVVVDIAGFEVRYLQNQKTVWQTRAQVGRPFRETPIFRSTIDHVVLNPTWTVPPTILAKDILPELRKDRGYLARKGLVLLDRNGHLLDPRSIDLPRSGGFPYTVRQEAGPGNALGVVKIMFPNPYHVYLHDTPSKSLFDQDTRAFSSGCIRTERPLELVYRLFATDPNWTPAALQSALATGQTRTVRLPKPVPVLMIYWTVDRDDDGSVVFKPDPYGRDPKLLAALNAPFVVGRREAP